MHRMTLLAWPMNTGIVGFMVRTTQLELPPTIRLYGTPKSLYIRDDV